MESLLLVPLKGEGRPFSSMQRFLVLDKVDIPGEANQSPKSPSALPFGRASWVKTPMMPVNERDPRVYFSW